MSVPGGKTSVFPPDHRAPGSATENRSRIRATVAFWGTRVYGNTRRYYLGIRTIQGEPVFSLFNPGHRCVPLPLWCLLFPPAGSRAHFSLAGWSCFATCPAVTLAASSVSEQEWWWLQHPHRPAHRARTPFCPTLTAAASAGLGCRYSASSWRRP